MGFSWSASHTILVLFIIAGFIGQVAVLFYRTGQLEKRQDKTDQTIKEQGETFFHALERLDDRIGKRLSDIQTETNHRFTEMNQRLSDMATEIRDVRSEMRQLNQNYADHLVHHTGEN